MIYKINIQNIPSYGNRLALYTSLVAGSSVFLVGILLTYIGLRNSFNSILPFILGLAIVFAILIYFLIKVNASSIKSRRWEINDEFVRQFIDLNEVDEPTKLLMDRRAKSGRLKLETVIKRKFISKIIHKKNSIVVYGLGRNRIYIPKEVRDFSKILTSLPAKSS